MFRQVSEDSGKIFYTLYRTLEPDRSNPQAPQTLPLSASETARLNKCRLIVDDYIDPHNEETTNLLWPESKVLFQNPSEAKVVTACCIVSKLIESHKPPLALISEFLESLLMASNLLARPSYIDYVSDLFHDIILRFSESVFSIVEKYNGLLIRELFSGGQTPPMRRYLSYSFLNQILKLKQYLVWKELKYFEARTVFETIMAEPPRCAFGSTHFLTEVMKFIGRLDKEEQKHYFSSFVMTLLMQSKEAKSDGFLRLFHFTYKYIFGNLHPSFFSKDQLGQVLETAIENVRQSFGRSDPEIVRLMCDMIPAMVSYQPLLFTEKKLLDTLLNILFSQITGKTSPMTFPLRLIFGVLTQVFDVFTTEQLNKNCERFALRIIELLSEYWLTDPKTNNGMVDLLGCFSTCLKHLKNVTVFPEDILQVFVSDMLVYHFDQTALSILEQLYQLPIPRFKNLLEKKMRYATALILKRDVKDLEDKRVNDELLSERMSRFDEDRDNLETASMDLHRLMGSPHSFKDAAKHVDLDTLSLVNLDMRYEGGGADGRLELRRGPLSKRMSLESALERRLAKRTDFNSFCEALKKRIAIIDSQPSPGAAVSPSAAATTVNRQAIIQEKRVAVALDALARFDFQDSYNVKRKTLIKDAVFDYLESDSIDLRRKASRIVFLLISDKTASDLESLSDNSLQGIIKKIMAIAIGDPDDQVRIEILTSLNSQMKPVFIPFILCEENLKTLVVMLNDANHRVQEQAVLLLQKLIPSFPELLARFEQMVFVSSSYLVTNRSQYSTKTLNNVRLLGVIARHSQFLLTNKLPVISGIMVQTLEDVTALVAADPDNSFYTDLLIATLECLGHLLNYQPDLARDHFRKCVGILISNFGRFKEEVLSATMTFMIILTRNAGLQLVMVIEYDIIAILMEFLERGGAMKLRINILRFLGTIGAIDPAMIRMIRDTIHKHRNRGLTPIQTYPKVMDKIRKTPFNFERNLLSNPLIEAHPMFLEFDAFVNEAFLIQRDAEAVLERYLRKTRSPDKFYLGQPVTPQFKKTRKFKIDQDKEPQMNFDEKIQNEDYLLRYVIHQTLSVLFDVILFQVDEKLIMECLESIQQIILVLGRHVYQFKRVIFYPLLQAFKQAPTNRIKALVVQDIKYFAKAANVELASDSRSVSKLSKLLLDHLQDPNLQADLLVICKLLVHNKTMLQHRFKDIVLELLKMLRQSPSKETVTAIFDIIIILNHNDYYYLITPALLELFPIRNNEAKRQKGPDFRMVELTLTYLRGILKTRHFEIYFGNILRALTSLIDAYPQIKEQVEAFLLEVFQMSGERCFNYLPLINPYLRRNQDYQRILRTLNEKGYIEMKAPPVQVDFEAAEDADPTSLDPEQSLRSHSLRRGSYDAIKGYFLINNFNKSDFNWTDWFSNLKHDLFSSSHSTILIACKNLLMEKKIIDRLFKPAFVLFWSQLNEHQKSQITRGFDSIISNTAKIQVTTRKKILELVEFMSHPNEFGMVLNITKLADFAINCHSPSKAIFFKELEFQTNPLNAIEALLNLYLEVGHRYAAEGLLDYVQNTLEIKVEEKWLQSLGKWDLVVENSGVETLDTSSLQVFSNIATSNWESAFHKIREIVQAAAPRPADTKISSYMAKAALHLGRWDVIQKNANDVSEEKDFYRAVSAFMDKTPEYSEAANFIGEELKTMEKSLQNYSNYASNYEKLVKLQKYVELEEAISHRAHFKALEDSELYNFLVPKSQQEEERRLFERHVLEVWEDKLFSMERSIDFWQEILATRNVFFSKNRMLNSYLKFSSLCYFTDNSQLFTRILTALKREIPANQGPNDALELAEIECNYKTGKIQLKKAITKIEELVARRTMPKEQIPLFYKKMGPWILNAEVKGEARDEKMIKFFERFLSDPKAKEDPRLWHYYAVANYQMIKDIDRHKADANIKYVLNAMIGFTNSVVHETKFNTKHTIQDLLKFLKLWYDYHDFHDNKGEKVTETIEKCIRDIPNKNWLLILRQVIARLEQNPTFSAAVKNLLVSLAKEFPQYLVFPLLLAKKSKDSSKARMITRLLGSADTINKQLVQEATMFSDQIIRISLLLDELWLQSFPEAYKFKEQNRIDSVISVLNSLFDITSARKGRSSLDEIAFFQKFGGDTKQAREFLDLYETTKNELFFVQAWNIYQRIVFELEGLRRFEGDVINLERVSPELFNMKNSALCVPGTLKRDVLKQRDIRIIQIKTVLKVLRSKRRPRKLSLYGSNGKEYSFLLKGKEDLRLDERVMQLLTVINDLLKPSISESNQAIKITTYNVLPLSYDCGIISWLEGWDTVYDTIRDYRSKIGVSMECERDLWREFHDNYNVLSKVKKLEVYNHVISNTKGVDLKNIFWLRSASADQWLSNRSNFICSVAVMSMVGYILGLGDRHLMNIMLERSTGKIVHIDFGECFESEQKRERWPEKVPFRLTRTMVNAMEACGIEGTFKRICETVMSILRLNKDVVLSFFEEFVVDPLITWKTTDKKDPLESNNGSLEDGKSALGEESKLHDVSFITDRNMTPVDFGPIRKDTVVAFDDQANKSRKGDPALGVLTNDKMLNPKAKAALNTIINKLNGKDFDNVENDHKTQVKKLIKQATNPENLSQAFTGWNPFL